MAIFFASLNSGSNGNCYYVGNDNEGVLIDAGIPCRNIEERLKELLIPLERIKAIFISHEHSDHIRGLAVFAKKFQLPVFITAATLRHCPGLENKKLIESFRAHTAIRIGNLCITAFPKQHDAIDPYSFVISQEGLQVGVFTDIGIPCDHLIHYFKQCQAVILESNYDEQMLENGRYPYFLKNRIRGGKGHLSNTQALSLFQCYRPAFMSHLVLGHLSEHNNCPDIVDQLFRPHSQGLELHVASRRGVSPLFQLGGSPRFFPGFQEHPGSQLRLPF